MGLGGACGIEGGTAVVILGVCCSSAGRGRVWNVDVGIGVGFSLRFWGCAHIFRSFLNVSYGDVSSR